MNRRLPERTTVDDLVIRRWTEDDAPALDAAVKANLEHLRSRMAWTAAEPLELEARRQLIADWNDAWFDGGDEVVLGVWRDDQVVAGTGLHRRGWPDGLEIGFWVAEACQGQGIATRVSAALADLVFAETDLDAVYLANDVENTASRRVSEKLGFTHLGQFSADRPLAPADTGIDDRWRLPRPSCST